MKNCYLKKGMIPLCVSLLTAFSMSGQNSYCVPTWSGWAVNEPTEPITLVQLGQNGVNGIDNPTSDVVSSDTPRYEDFSALSMDVVKGESYTLKVKGNTDGDNTNYITVYFDWNGDGIFSNSTPTDIGEQQQWTNQKEKHQHGMSLINSTGVDNIEVSYTVNIPTDAVTGEIRMRVVKNYNAPSPAPCDNPFIFGQVEDYTINILASEDDCAAVETFFYDFEDFTTFPEQCWDWKMSPEPPSPPFVSLVYVNEDDPADKHLNIYAFTYTAYDFYLISPAVSTINGQYFLEFEARLNSALGNGSTLQVGTLSSQTDVSDFVPVGDLIYPTLTDQTYTTVAIPTTPGHQYVAIKFVPAGNHSTVLIDNVEWKQADNVSVTSVEVTTQDNVPAEITTENGTLQLVATVNPSDADQDVIWSVVTGSDFASVDDNGLVTAAANGTVAVRAISVEDETVFGEINITVSNQQTSVTDAPDAEWAGLFGGTGSDIGWAIATDSEGNSFTAGQFAGTATFGTTTLTSAGGADIFVTKTSPSGEALWAVQFGSTSTDMGWAVDTDSEGNVYVTGRFAGTVAFGTTTLTSEGNSDVFLIKINTSGTVVWAKQFGGTSADMGRAIAVDTSGNVYVAGTFTGSATFDGASLTSSGGSDIFVVKIDSNGTVLWADQYGGSETDIAHGITVDTAGDIYITGQFTGSPVFGAETLTATGAIDSFVIKINESGTIIWTQQFEGVSNSNYIISENITVDTLGNVYVTGELSGGATFGSVTLTSSGTADIFVAKISNAGDVSWAKQFGGTDSEVGYDIVTDAENDIYITGYFNGTSSFDSVTLTSNGGNDIFVTKINGAGTVLWAKQFGGTGTDISKNIAVGLPDNIYITGQFSDTVVFGEYTLTATGGNDVFIVKLGETQTPVIVESVTIATENNIPAEITTENGTLQLVATVTPTEANQDVVWTSSGQAVVTVDSDGLVTAVANGTATITATSVEDETIFGEIEIVVDIESSSDGYCDVTVEWDVEPITLVDFADLNNSTSAIINGTPAYEDFTSMTANIEQGETYTITVKGNTNGNFEHDIRVFIDWNQDFEFDMNTEFYVTSLLPSNGEDSVEAIIEITVPTDAVLGNTRMRITKDMWNVYEEGEFDACIDAYYGQVEDYTVNIEEATSGIGNFDSVSTSLYPNPTNGILNIISDVEINQVEIYNINGQRILKLNDSRVDLSRFSAGIYLVRVTSEEGRISTHKVVKN